MPDNYAKIQWAIDNTTDAENVEYGLNANRVYNVAPLPPEVWVDDDWAGSSLSDPIDRHILDYDTFDNIQDDISGVKAEAASLADTPWPMFHHDLQHTGRSPYTGPENPAEKWSFEGAGGSSPVIGADSTIYVGSNDGKLYAINPDGTEKWSFGTGLWLIAAPALSTDGTIYVGSWGGKLYAFNPNGTEKWNFTTDGTIRSSPAIGAHGIIYVGSEDRNLYAINPDGSLGWNFTTEFKVTSSPAIGTDGTIYAGSQDGNLYAINPDGTEKWRFTAARSISSSPAIGTDGTIYLGSTYGGCQECDFYAVNLDGTLKWHLSFDCPISCPSIGADGTVYVSSWNRKLCAISPSGSFKWSLPSETTVRSSPTIGADGTIYIGSLDHNLYAINPDGSEKWSFNTDGWIESPAAIDADGTIYVGGGNKLYAIREPLNITQAKTDKSTYALNENVTISCVVKNETGYNITADTVNTDILKPDHLIEKVILNEELIGNYNGIFTNTSLLGIYNVTIHASKVGFVNNTAELSFEVLPDHDIAVTDIAAPNVTEINSTIFINSTISNLGLNNESDINVDFIVDGVNQSITAIPFLESGASTNISFLWTVPNTAPNTSGIYNITIYAEPLENETIVWNNRMETYISVAIFPVHNLNTSLNYYTIQAAINASETLDGHIIQVNSGMYYENIIVSKSLTLQGEDRNTTVIDGSDKGSVVTIFDVSFETVLDDFTITNGTGTSRGSYYTYGGGIYVSNSSLSVRNTTITENRASDGAGGIEAYHSTINVSNNNISDNSGWWGGAITLHGCDAKIVDNIIDKNDCGYGGAIFITESSEATIVNNQITRTSIGLGYSPSIGIGESSIAVIICNTICDNLGDGIATGTYATGGEGSATITNCILWGNGHDDLAGLTATYSDIEDGDPGEGSISADPMFVDPGDNDYHLQPVSPCIDAGTNEGAPEADFEGDPRPFDGDGDGIATVDIGADELRPILSHDIALQTILAPPTDIPVGVTVTPVVRLQNIGANPESGFPVTCEIKIDGEQVYFDTKTVLSLSCMESANVTFAN